MRTCRKCSCRASRGCRRFAPRVTPREHPDVLMIARTDAAWAYNDVEDAIARVNAFTDAGADLVMPVGIGPKKLASSKPAKTN